MDDSQLNRNVLLNDSNLNRSSRIPALQILNKYLSTYHTPRYINATVHKVVLVFCLSTLNNLLCRQQLSMEIQAV